MGIDLSRLRRGNDHDRRPWHGAAFIVEALVLLVFLIASLAVIMQVIAGAHERSIEADRLSNAIILASNDAEAFAADPTSGNTGGEYVLVDGQAQDDDQREQADGADTNAAVGAVHRCTPSFDT